MPDSGDSSREHHSEEEYLDAVRENEPAATSEVAEAVGVARQSAHHRLDKLKEKGLVTKQTIGNSLAWSVAEDG